MLIYGFAFQGLGTLAKLLAIAIGLSLLTLLFPQIRGVRKGDSVLIAPENEGVVFYFLKSTSGIALKSGRKGDMIKVVLTNGAESDALITEYEGLLAPAKVRLVSKEYNINVA